MRRLIPRLLSVLVLAAVVTGAAVWAARIYLAHALTARAVQPDAADALIPELADLGSVGIEPLAAAAASTKRSVALAAREEIDRLVRHWAKLEFEQPGITQDPSRQQLAVALLGQADSFSPAGQQWLAGVASRLLRDSTGRVGNTELVTACDQLLAAARQRSRVLDTVEPPRSTVSSATADTPAVIKPTPWQPVTPSPQRSVVAEPESTMPIAVAPRTELPSSTLEPVEPREVLEPAASRQITPSPQPAPITSSPAPIARLPWQSPGRVGPTATGPRGRSSRRHIATIFVQPYSLSLALAATLPDRMLLAIALNPNSDSPIDPLIRAAVIGRGFGAASRQQLQDAISKRESIRAALVDNVVIARSGSSSRLLLLLASDESPRVRRAAIAALGNSHNRLLVDAAWRMAVRDPDPTVAQLADELRRR
ncbi:MAG: hypothetical protein AAGF31_07710 [Planctomycetota bacterium]